MQRFVSTLWCQFLRANLFWKSPLSHLLTWEFWKRQHPPLPQTAPVRLPWWCSHSWASWRRARVAWKGDIATAQCSGWSLHPCVFDPISSLSLVRETLTTQTPSLHKALATPFTADSGTAFKTEMALLSRKTKPLAHEKKGTAITCAQAYWPKVRLQGEAWPRAISRSISWLTLGGKKQRHHLHASWPRPAAAGGWTGWELALRRNTSANTGMEHSCPSPGSQWKAFECPWPHAFCSLKFCSSLAIAGTAISYSRVKGPAHPLRSRSNARQP